MKILFSSLIFFFSFVFVSHAQDKQEIFNYLGLNIKYGLNIPGGDYADRFGNNNEAGIGLEYFLEKSNMILSADASILFGNEVKEDVLEDLRLENGQILGVSGDYASVFTRQRATYFGLMVEKILGKQTYRRGIKLGIGAGLFSHKIRLQNATVDVPQIRGDYEKGYDHKTVGPALRERISYNYVNNARKVYFTVGLEFTQAFTSNIRALNYDTYTAEDESRLDLLFGLYAKWTLPLMQNKPAGEIFY